jgi:hypothetical protein
MIIHGVLLKKVTFEPDKLPRQRKPTVILTKGIILVLAITRKNTVRKTIYLQLRTGFCIHHESNTQILPL